MCNAPRPAGRILIRSLDPSRVLLDVSGRRGKPGGAAVGGQPQRSSAHGGHEEARRPPNRVSGGRSTGTFNNRGG